MQTEIPLEGSHNWWFLGVIPLLIPYRTSKKILWASKDDTSHQIGQITHGQTGGLVGNIDQPPYQEGALRLASSRSLWELPHPLLAGALASMLG